MAKLKIPKPVTIDFETQGIVKRPFYPPVPVGVSIKYPGKAPKYYSWGHKVKNNCTYGMAREALLKAWTHKDGILCQNAKFDTDVGETHLDMPVLPWGKVHDTMYLIYLNDPHQRDMSLKPSADLLLNMPAEEQDAVSDWLIENQPVPGVKISKSKKSEHYFGRYIAYAPADIVGKYADGDVIRTEKLFELLYPKVYEAGMLHAYDRERKVMPILLQMERNGVPVDVEQLDADIESYSLELGKVEDWICKFIKAPIGINLDSGAELMEAMIASKKVDKSDIPLTPTGKYQTNKEALDSCIKNPLLASMLAYRSQMKTCLNTFMIPWAKMAVYDGRIYTTWNQTKSTEGAGSVGTRTGRLSSTPNFQNIPKEFKPLFDHEAVGKKLPKAPWPTLPLPKVRGYVMAPKGKLLIGRDFSAQELRILAHFEDGSMAQGYLDNPRQDLHAYAAKLITETTGTTVIRQDAKTIAFAILYGSGLGALAAGLGCSVEQASALKKAYLNTFPGIKDIQAELKNLSRAKEPLTTFGGRKYYCEPSKVINGRLVDFSYKMTNYLIQGSAADQTKDAVIRYWDAGGFRKAPLILLVHDELVAEIGSGNEQDCMAVLRAAMDNAGLDVPMVSEGETGIRWSQMTEFNDGN